MATALVIEHVENEHAGLLREWLPAAGLDLEVCRPWAGDAIPVDVRADALVVLGGPMDAFADDGDQPAERALLAHAVDAGRAVLGICLGAQLLALAAGGRVERAGAGAEFGTGLVRRSDIAVEDPVFAPLPFLPDVVHWHRDKVSVLPPGAVLLCRGTHTENQAFRVGERAWGLQFHIEVTPAMLAAWAQAEGMPIDPLLADLAAIDLESTWRPSVEQFARVSRGTFSGAWL